MATIPTQTHLSSDQLALLATDALRATMFLSITDPRCAEALAARMIAFDATENHSTLSESQLRLDAIKRAIWHAWDNSPELVDYRRACVLDDDLDISPEDALPVLYAKFSQLRTLISCAEKILEPLGNNVFLTDVRQLLGTASDIAGGAMTMQVFEEVAA